MIKKQKKSCNESYIDPNLGEVHIRDKGWVPSIDDELSKSVARSLYLSLLKKPASSKSLSDKDLYIKISKFNKLCNDMLEYIEDLNGIGLLLDKEDSEILINKLNMLTLKNTVFLQLTSNIVTDNQKRGRKPDYLLNQYIRGMIDVWKSFTEDFPTLTYDPVDCIYKGHFFNYTYDSLKVFGYKPLPTNPTMGKKIQREIKKLSKEAKKDLLLSSR
ncbi:MAG: hypothetical protein GX654_18200 [Desulfatiglans sp.]|nr:hypothetical protein [Desulfatiglans sp.]